VTATTVGYGDSYPTTTVGKWIACIAMMMGVLVIAFPVSVFSELWSKELRLQGALDVLDNESNHGEPEIVREETVGHRAQMSCDTLPEAGHGRQPSLEHLLSDQVIPSALTIDNEHLIMRKEDLKSLMNHIVAIHEVKSRASSISTSFTELMSKSGSIAVVRHCSTTALTHMRM
jgi:Ion channel